MTPEQFATLSRAEQLAYLYATYGGTIEDRARDSGQNNVTSTGKWRAHNIATGDYVSAEERRLWSLVKNDGGTWLGGALSSAAPVALAAGLIAAGGTAAGLWGGGGSAAGAAGAGTAAGAGGAGTGAGLGIFSNGGAAGLAGVGGGSAGALAAAGGIAGGAGVGGTVAGALGGLSGVANAVSGVGGSMGWMDWVPSLVSAGAAIYGGDKSADAIKDGTKEALGETRRQFDLVRSDTAPIRALGTAAVDRIGRLYGYGTNAAGAANTPDMGAFFESPDYQFNLAEGQKAIDRSLIARSGGLGGAAVKEGIRFASGSASREFGPFVDRLMQQAGLGSNGTAQSAAAGANTASNVAGVSMNAANSRASIYGNTAASVNNSIQTGVGNWMLQKYLGTGGQTPPYAGS